MNHEDIDRVLLTELDDLNAIAEDTNVDYGQRLLAGVRAETIEELRANIAAVFFDGKDAEDQE